LFAEPHCDSAVIVTAGRWLDRSEASLSRRTVATCARRAIAAGLTRDLVIWRRDVSTGTARGLRGTRLIGGIVRAGGGAGVGLDVGGRARFVIPTGQRLGHLKVLLNRTQRFLRVLLQLRVPKFACRITVSKHILRVVAYLAVEIVFLECFPCIS